MLQQPRENSLIAHDHWRVLLINVSLRDLERLILDFNYLSPAVTGLIYQTVCLPVRRHADSCPASSLVLLVEALAPDAIFTQQPPAGVSP